MQPGDLIDLDIADVAHGGVFVARHGAERGGRVVFVSDAIPGERVRVRLTRTGDGSFWRGETVEVLEASPHRRAHVWRAADVDVPPEMRPGGADFGHIELAHQRELKVRVIADAMRRIGGIEVPLAIEAASGASDAAGPETADGTRWRTRVGLHVDADGRVGPFAARSHRVVPVDDLPLATAAVERAARGLRGREGRIDLVEPSDGRVRVIPRPERRGRRRGSAADPAHEVVVERVAGREFRVDAGGFWQVHRLAAACLTDRVRGVLRDLRPDGPGVDPDAAHLDLYGGVGLFAAALADLGGAATRVTSVESDPRATGHAAENLAEWDGARAETGRVDRWLSRLVSTASEIERARLREGTVVLDPPRAGAGAEVVDAIAALRPAVVVYVACDPVALARDLTTFRAHGYQAPALHAVDLFPHSHHVEVVTALTRA